MYLCLVSVNDAPAVPYPTDTLAIAFAALSVAVRALQGKPLSEAAIAQRAAQYGGVGRAAFYTGMEGSATTQRGYVARYVARDDDRTCVRCLDAEARGPYLPGDGPKPGDVCLGRHRCRCTRELVYDPAAWARLTGRVAA